MAPELPPTRYHYSAMLALSGRLDDSMRELLSAIKIDDSYAAKASADVDFDSLRERQDFQEQILKKARPGPLPPP